MGKMFIRKIALLWAFATVMLLLGAMRIFYPAQANDDAAAVAAYAQAHKEEFAEFAKKLEVLNDSPATEATPVYFSIDGVNNKEPRLYA